jgi:hypothetical protein
MRCHSVSYDQWQVDIDGDLSVPKYYITLFYKDAPNITHYIFHSCLSFGEARDSYGYGDPYSCNDVVKDRRILGSDGNYYVCTQSALEHPDCDSLKPITGANWSSYWTLDGAYDVYDECALSFGSQTHKNTWPILYGGTATVEVAGSISHPLWAVSTSYSESDVVFNDGNTYACIQAHTSSASDEPGTGANWETYWQESHC